MVEGAMRWSWMLLAFSSLSFLGFGVSPPTPDWGLMVADSRTFLAIAPWSGLYPIVALSSLIIGINLTADALARDAGMDSVMDRCVKIEHGRFFGGLNLVGVNTGVISA